MGSAAAARQACRQDLMWQLGGGIINTLIAEGMNGFGQTLKPSLSSAIKLDLLFLSWLEQMLEPSLERSLSVRTTNSFRTLAASWDCMV